MHQVFGIRHHGPGSCRRLLAALENMQPDCLLVEGPEDGNGVLPLAANKFMIPPVALLIYNPKDFKQASYYPFTEFSPEWQAIQYGLANQIPTSFFDLPMSKLYPQKEEIQQSLLLSKQSAGEYDELRKDPLGYMAKIAGYEDRERWWEINFEHWSSTELFGAVNELMQALREDLSGTESLEEIRREAYMRESIRRAQKAGFRKIAVVCGAWHGPALTDLKSYPAKRDKDALKGLKRTKTTSTWIPWTYARISSSSGYGAGVHSPAYYQILYHHNDHVVEYWMSYVVDAFRKEGYDMSSAHAIEGVKLAKTLSDLRGLKIPGLPELRSAAVSILCDGNEIMLRSIEQSLLNNNSFGSVAKEVPVVPLQKDLEKQIKSARLSKEKKAPDQCEKILDLRIESNLKASKLLHRLRILDIPWGQSRELKKFGMAGTFHESWSLHWLPEYALRLIERNVWGGSIEEASTNYALNKAEKESDIKKLIKLIEDALKGDLKETIPSLSQMLAIQTAQTKDALILLEMVPVLVQSIRYGTVRKLNVSSLSNLLEEIIPRLCIGLPFACGNLNEDQASIHSVNIRNAHSSIYLFDQPEFISMWVRTLKNIQRSAVIKGEMRGLACRLLFDKGIYDELTTQITLQFALSPANEPKESASWLEGFLSGSGLILIHNNKLWSIVREWVASLDTGYFETILPLLRRTFSSFSSGEREKTYNLLRSEPLLNANINDLSIIYSQNLLGVTRRIINLSEN